MNAKQFRKALATLGLSQNGWAKLIGTDPRTVRRWALDESPVPGSVVILLRLMLNKTIVPLDIEQVMR